jgi:HAMP domain-containing protein
MPLIVEKTRLNAWNVGGLLVVMATQLIGGTLVWNNLTRDVKEIHDVQLLQDQLTSQRFQGIEQRIAPIPSVVFAQVQQDKEIADLKQQVAMMVQKFGDKLDNINDSINSVRTEVRVLAQEVRNTATEKPHPTAFKVQQ